MVALYVTSSEEAVGKTTLCAGLGKYLLSDGKKLGFFKPIITDNKPVESTDSDTEFMKHIFALKEPLGDLCPVIRNEGNLANNIKKVFVLSLAPPLFKTKGQS